MNGLRNGGRPARWRRDLSVWFLWLIANLVAMAPSGVMLDAFGLVGIPLFGIAGGITQWLMLRWFWPVRARWVIATAAGGLGGWFSGFWAAYAGGLLIYIVVGIGVRAAQALGFHTGLETQESLSVEFSRIFAHAVGTIGGATGGAVVGLFQSFILQRHVQTTGRWIMASALAGAAAGGLSGFDLFVRATSPPTGVFFGEAVASPRGGEVFLAFPNGLVSGAVFGGVYAAITGIALVWLLARPASGSDREDRRS